MNVNGGFVVNEPGVAQLAERLFKMIWHPFPHFYLNLTQFWRCPVLWCTTWKGTPTDCVDHIRQKHLVPLLRRLTWHAGFCHGQSPERYGARP